MLSSSFFMPPNTWSTGCNRCEIVRMWTAAADVAQTRWPEPSIDVDDRRIGRCLPTTPHLSKVVDVSRVREDLSFAFVDASPGEIVVET